MTHLHCVWYKTPLPGRGEVESVDILAIYFKGIVCDASYVTPCEIKLCVVVSEICIFA
jgi:hypothetical protein